MRELLLDAEQIHTRQHLHDAFAGLLGLGESYGRNLDALYDVLTVCPRTRLTLRHAESFIANLGNYGELVLRVLADAAVENPDFVLEIA